MSVDPRGAAAPRPEPQGAGVRAAASKAIRAVRFDGVSLKAVLPKALAGLRDPRDRALCEAICFDAVRWLPRYDAVLARLLDRPLATSARDVHGLLLAGLAQLDAMQLADYAAMSSTVEAVRVLGQPRLVGMVNGVLRRFLREREALFAAVDADPATRHAHPQWLIDTLQRDWPEALDATLAANNAPAPLWLRVNLRHGTRAAYLERLRAEGLDADAPAIAPAALRLHTHLAPTRLPGWDAGDVSVQDLAAQLAAPALGVLPGERVLDAGAAPGGKTAHLLEAHPDIELVALDRDARRLQRVGETLARLGLKATVQAGDASAPDGWWSGRAFDRILLDAPCSGTGIVRRQPDIKWHRRAADIPALAALQARLLDGLWPLLRPGGRLLYATCSVLKDENEHQIDAFLARTRSAAAIALPDRHGRASGSGRQRLPGEDGGDGFFYAALEKRVDAPAAAAGGRAAGRVPA